MFVDLTLMSGPAPCHAGMPGTVPSCTPAMPMQSAAAAVYTAENCSVLKTPATLDAVFCGR